MGSRFRTTKQSEGTSHWPALLGGVGVGAALAYLLNPSLGRTRRARARDKAVHAAHTGNRGARRAQRVVTNRAYGLAARLRAAFGPKAAADEVIQERVRAAIGRVCSHAGAIEVLVANGEAVLGGRILEREHDRVVREVARVRGVRGVDDQLQRHVHPGTVPGLQGSHRPPAPAKQAARCADLMKREVRTVAEDDTIDRVAELMTMANIGFLPVCDRQRRVVGAITDRDLVVRVLAKGLSPAICRAVDVMSRDPAACRRDDDVVVAEELMAQRQVSRLMITSDDGVLEGVMSLSDIAAREPPRRAAVTLRAVAGREAQRT